MTTKPSRRRWRNDLLLVAAARLDADPLDPLLPQPGRQRRMAIRSVVDLQFRNALAGAPHRACACRYRYRRRPCYACSSSSTLPCDANPRFLQPSGSDEEPTAILLRDHSPQGCGGQRSDDRRSGLGGHPGRTIPHGTIVTIAIRADTRVGKGARQQSLRKIARAPCPRGNNCTTRFYPPYVAAEDVVLRHPEVRAQRASKGDGPRLGRSSFEARARSYRARRADFPRAGSSG